MKRELLKPYFSSSNRKIGKDAIFLVFVAGVGFQAFALKRAKEKRMVKSAKIFRVEFMMTPWNSPTTSVCCRELQPGCIFRWVKI
jgi:hypothetical protein